MTDNDDLLRLVKLASSGDNEALSLLVSKMIPDVRREASKFSGAVGVDSDDLFQEGMIGLLSAARSYKTDCGASFRTYASVCIRNRIISAVKKASGGKSVRRDLLVPLETELLSVPELSYDDGLVVKEECDRLFGFIETQLSERERSILKLFLSGLSYGEIAQKLGSSSKSVDNALQRVRRKLNKYN